MEFLRQSTARTVAIGPFVLHTDGNTTLGNLTVSQADIQLSKAGGNFSQSNNAAGAPHYKEGWYAVPLDTTDTNTLGTLKLEIKEALALPVWETMTVLPQEIYDAFIAGNASFPANVRAFGNTAGTFSSGRPEVNTTHIAGSAVNTSSAQLGVNVVNAAGTAWGSGAITAASIASDAITAAKIATGAITSAKFAAGAIDAAAIANGAIDAATFAADVDAEILSYLVDDATRIDASALNTASSAVGSNGSGLTEAGGTGDHLTAIPSIGNITGVPNVRIASGVAHGNATATLTLQEFSANVMLANSENVARASNFVGLATSAEVTAIGNASTIAAAANTTLSAAHGNGSWETATGFTVPGNLPTNFSTLTLTANQTIASVGDLGNVTLKSTGLDQIAITGPSGAASTFREMVVQTWRRFFKKRRRQGSNSAGNITIYADDGTTPVTVQTYTSDGTGNETINAPS